MTFDPIEQDELVRAWWSRHGKNLLTGLALVLALILAGQWWWNQQQIKRANASVVYTRLSNQLGTGNVQEAQSLAGKLMEESPDSPYAVLAALAVARLEVEGGKLDQALQRLAWAEERAGFIAGGHDLVRLRQARIQMAKEQWDQALATLNRIESAAFAGLAAALRGDVYRWQGELDKARTAYRTALSAPSVGDQERSLIQMKLDDIGGGEAG